MSKTLGIRKAHNKDYQRVIDISRKYIRDHGHEFFPCDLASLRLTFTNLLKAPYFRVCEVDGEVRAWMAGQASSPHGYSLVRCLTQTFLHVDAEGILAVRIVKAFHTDFLEQAKLKGFQVACSSSFLPDKEDFYRVLQGCGWKITPVGALRKVDYG